MCSKFNRSIFFGFQDRVHCVLKKSKHSVLKNFNRVCNFQTYGGILLGYTQELPLKMIAQVFLVFEIWSFYDFSNFFKKRSFERK